VEDARARELLGGARVARFGTIAPGGPVLVPICFVLAGDVIYHAIDDHKPKATRRVARLANLAADPRATVLADHYEEDWSALWWVRADGRARVLEDTAASEAARALDLLAQRYAQYRERRPPGPVVALDVERLTGWAAR
jgi:PPOX class probable F420-dependent enzyme